MNNSLLKNSLSSIVQFLVNSITLFIFYKFLLNTIGPEDIGIWAMVLGMSSLGQIASFGFSGGAVKYVAQYLSWQREDKVADVIQTSLLSVGFLVAIFVFLVYPFIKLFIIHATGAHNANKVEQILPLGLISLWLMICGNVLFSSLDGYQRMYLRNYILMSSAVINLCLCFFVIPKFQIQGLAYLSLFQNLLLVAFCWIQLKRLNGLLPIFPFRWNRELFIEIIGYNVKFQLISFSAMFCEPITKYFLGIFGGIASVAYYEMASRLSAQIRGVIVSSNQAIVPTIANYAYRKDEKIREIYINSFHLLLFIIVPLYSILLLAVPLISHIWIGSNNKIFIFAIYLFFISHIFNILSNPAYFSNIGTGQLASNLIAHLGMATSNIILSYFFGKLWGGLGVITAWAITFLLGSLYIFICYNKKHKISLNILFPKNLSRLLLFVFFISSFSIVISLVFINHSIVLTNIVVIFFAAVFIAYSQWKHPFRIKIFGWFYGRNYDNN